MMGVPVPEGSQLALGSSIATEQKHSRRESVGTRTRPLGMGEAVLLVTQATGHRK